MGLLAHVPFILGRIGPFRYQLFTFLKKLLKRLRISRPGKREARPFPLVQETYLNDHLKEGLDLL